MISGIKQSLRKFAQVFRKGETKSIAILSILIIGLSLFVVSVQQQQLSRGTAGQIPITGELVDAETDVFGRVVSITSEGVLSVKNISTGEESRLVLSAKPVSLALDQSEVLSGASGNIYLVVVVVDTQDSKLKKFDLNGTLVNTYDASNSVAVTTDEEGKIYSLAKNGLISIINKDGSVSTDGSLINASVEYTDITVDANGKIFTSSREMLQQLVLRNKFQVPERKSSSSTTPYVSVDSFGNVSRLERGVFTKTKGDREEQLGTKNLGSVKAVIATQRFALQRSPVSDLELAIAADLHHGMYQEEPANVGQFQDLLDKTTYVGSKLVTKVGNDLGYQDAVDIVPDLPGCPKPEILEAPEGPNSVSPIRDKFGRILTNTVFDTPGLSERIFLTPKEGNPYGTSMDPKTGNYAIRLGIETDKWDILAREGICPPQYIKEQIVDRMNAALERARDVNGNPVSTRLVLLSWELYDRHYFTEPATSGGMTYVPRWYGANNEGTGYDLEWLLRPSRSEVPPEEKFKMNIAGRNSPWIGAIDIPCELNESYCWWAVMHETGHTMDLGDLYQWDIPERDNLANSRSYKSIWNPDLMYGGTDDLSTYSATHLNRTHDARVSGQYDNRVPNGGTLYGAYYKVGHPEDRPYAFYFNALTSTTSFGLVDYQGKAMPGLEIAIIPSNKRCRVFSNLPQCESFFGQWNSQFFAEDSLSSEAYLNNQTLAPESVYTVVADAQGKVMVDTLELTRRDKNIWFREADGVWVDWVTIYPERAINYLILAQRKSDNLKFYGFAELTQINLEAVRGKSQADIKVVMTPDLKEVRIQPK